MYNLNLTAGFWGKLDLNKYIKVINKQIGRTQEEKADVRGRCKGINLNSY